MTTGQKVFLTLGTLGVGWTIFYFAYWQGRNAVKPADIPVLEQNTVALGADAPAAAGISLSDITEAI
jgi:hypothetical protein